MKFRNIAIALFLVVALFCVTMSPVLALGSSGHFNNQEFILVKGETSEGQDNYVTYWNSESVVVTVRLETSTPEHVAIVMTETEFVLQPGEQKRVDVYVDVGKKAKPGEYVISINGCTVPTAEGGLQFIVCIIHRAKLTVLSGHKHYPGWRLLRRAR